MRKRLKSVSVLFLVCLSANVLADDWKLLTGNLGGGDMAFENIPSVYTGATYTWLTSEPYAKLSTDPEIINNDPGYGKLLSGSSAAAGGGHAIWGAWDGVGTAAALFDLKSHCLIAKVELSALYMNFSDAWQDGVAHFEVWVNNTDDPNGTYTLFGVWQGPYPDIQDNADQNVILAIESTPVAARFVQLVVSRHAQEGYTWEHWWHCLVLGEAALYGQKLAQDCPEVLGMGHQITGDINGDCYVNLGDIVKLAEAWCTTTDPASSPQVNAANGIFGVAGHMIHTDLFSYGTFDSSWRVENTRPWLIIANFGWTREPLYNSYFVDANGVLNARTAEIIELYLDYYDSAGVKVVLAPMFGPDIDTQFNAFFTWVAQLAQTHSCVKVIEMGNEANLTGFWSGTLQQYIDCCAAAYPLIKSISPNTEVSVGAFSGWGNIYGDDELTCPINDIVCKETKWAQTCFQSGLLNYCDAVSCHPYRANGTGPECGTGWSSTSSTTGFEDELDSWYAMIQTYKPAGKNINLYFTEIGYSSAAYGGTSQSGVGSELVKAEFLSRLMLIMLNARVEGMPIKGVNWYDLKKDQTADTYEANFGLISVDAQTPTDSFNYYARIAKSFNNASALAISTASSVFSVNPSQIKKYCWQTSDGRIILPFWRMNTLGSAGSNFSSAVQLSGISGTAKKISLHDTSTDSVQNMAFAQTGSSLSLTVTVKSNACWLEIVF